MGKKDEEMLDSIIGALTCVKITTGGDYGKEISWLRKLAERLKTKKKVYALVQTDSTDSTWCNITLFKKRKAALDEMWKMYTEEVLSRDDVTYRDYDEKIGRAYAEMVDDITFTWNVKECEIQ